MLGRLRVLIHNLNSRIKTRPISLKWRPRGCARLTLASSEYALSRLRTCNSGRVCEQRQVRIDPRNPSGQCQFSMPEMNVGIVGQLGFHQLQGTAYKYNKLLYMHNNT